MKKVFHVLLLCLLVTGLSAENSGENRAPCLADQNYEILEFWVGVWDVYAGRQKVGTNRIERILNSCAVIEHWKDIVGHEGKSLFYIDSFTRKWKQVWVTDLGAVKEKALQQVRKDGGVIFQGEVRTASGQTVLDRTTLWPEAETVRQVIEQSLDGGKTWNVLFDGVYRTAGEEAVGR